MELTGSGERPQFGVGRGRPEEEAETRGEFPFIDGGGLLSCGGLLAAIQESRRNQYTGDQPADGEIVR